MCLCLSIAFSSALLCLSIAFSSALLCLSIFDTVLAVPKLPLSPFLLSHVHCFVSVLLSQLPCSVSVSLTPFLSLLCPSCLVTVLALSCALLCLGITPLLRCLSITLLLLSHVPCFVQLSITLLSHVLCFVSASRRSYAMPCLVSACYHTITPLFSALPFSGYSIMTIISYHVDRLRIAS